MTTVHPSAIDELCHTLGLRTSYPVGSTAREPLSDDQVSALGVLAAPEAIAVVSHRAQTFMHVIATRGPLLAEHTVDHDTHHLRLGAADEAALVLLERCGLLSPRPCPTGAIDVPIAALRRVQELVRTGDVVRARATLVSEGAPLQHAAEFVDAMCVGVVEVAGLGSDGRRFTGCELAIAGNDETGRWLVPTTQQVDPLPRNAFHHPSLQGVRVLLERVDPDELVDELSLVFGDAY